MNILPNDKDRNQSRPASLMRNVRREHFRRSKDWVSVCRARPCPVCGKGNRCFIAVDGTDTCLCVRVASPYPVGTVGWYHKTGPRRRPCRNGIVALGDDNHRWRPPGDT
jgi:hypothetical protein